MSDNNCGDITSFKTHQSVPELDMSSDVTDDQYPLILRRIRKECEKFLREQKYRGGCVQQGGVKNRYNTDKPCLKHPAVMKIFDGDSYVCNLPVPVKVTSANDNYVFLYEEEPILLGTNRRHVSEVVMVRVDNTIQEDNA